MRLALAAQAEGDSDADALLRTLAERFAEARLRGDVSHRREEARFQLHLQGDATGALSLALANWQVQREPWDARLVLEAALAAHQPASAAPVRDWLAARGNEDVQLAPAGRGLGSGIVIRRALALGLILAGLAGALPASAHKSSDAYLAIAVEQDVLTVRWDIALRDLDIAVGLDPDEQGRVTWGTLRQHFAAIDAYALSRLVLTGDGRPCPFGTVSHRIDRHSDGAYAVLDVAAQCPAAPHAIGIQYRLLFDLDPQHRGLVTVRDGDAVHTNVLGPERSFLAVSLQSGTTSAFWEFVRLGAEHILGGRDHLLFLAVLLMPALGRLQPGRVRRTLGEIAGLMSLFTLAHAVTVTLAVRGVLQVPASISEAAIALSIVVTAIDNIRPILGQRRGVIAFGFGLIHGLGFASALGPLALTGWSLVAALAGFNSGIELVQLGLAGLAIAVAIPVRRVFAQAGRLSGAAIGPSISARSGSPCWPGFGLSDAISTSWGSNEHAHHALHDLLLAAMPAAAHGVETRIIGNGAATVEFKFADGMPLAFAEAVVMAPDGTGEPRRPAGPIGTAASASSPIAPARGRSKSMTRAATSRGPS
ncbi:MAG: HupE/UreJ family protein [Aliidongia sp.]